MSQAFASQFLKSSPNVHLGHQFVKCFDFRSERCSVCLKTFRLHRSAVKCTSCTLRFHLKCQQNAPPCHSYFGPDLTSSLVADDTAIGAFSHINQHLPRAVMRRSFSRAKYIKKCAHAHARTAPDFWPPDDFHPPTPSISPLLSVTISPVFDHMRVITPSRSLAVSHFHPQLHSDSVAAHSPISDPTRSLNSPSFPSPDSASSSDSIPIPIQHSPISSSFIIASSSNSSSNSSSSNSNHTSPINTPTPSTNNNNNNNAPRSSSFTSALTSPLSLSGSRRHRRRSTDASSSDNPKQHSADNSKQQHSSGSDAYWQHYPRVLPSDSAEVACLKAQVHFLTRLIPDPLLRKDFALVDDDAAVMFLNVRYSTMPHFPLPPPEQPCDVSMNIARCYWLSVVCHLAYSSPLCTHLVATRFMRCAHYALFDNPITDCHGIGIVGKGQQYVLIAFRGTDNAANWNANLSASMVDLDLDSLEGAEGGRSVSLPDVAAFSGQINAEVADDIDDAAAPASPLQPVDRFLIHRGFQHALRSLWPQLERFVASLPRPLPPIYLTGHSLGGAMAVVAYIYMLLVLKVQVQGVYTFGQPRVVNAALRAYLDSKPVVIQRIRNRGDPVPTIPPMSLGYVHAGHSTLIKSNGTVSVMPTKAEKRSAMLNRVSSITTAVKDHSQANYISAFSQLKASLEKQRESYSSDLPVGFRYAVLTVHHARNLPDVAGHPPSAMVQIKFPSYLTLFTPAVPNSQHPSWGASFHVHEVFKFDEIQFTVLHRRRVLGKTHIKLYDLMQRPEQHLLLDTGSGSSLPSALVISLRFFKYPSGSKPCLRNKLLGKGIRSLLRYHADPNCPHLPLVITTLTRYIADHCLNMSLINTLLNYPSDYEALRQQINCNDLSFFANPHCVHPQISFVIFLNFIQYLPFPLTGISLYPQWIKQLALPSLPEQLGGIKEVLALLRPWEYLLLQTFCFVAFLILKNHHLTGLDTSSLGRQLGPFLFAPGHPNESGEPIEIIEDLALVNYLIELLIVHYHVLFTPPLAYQIKFVSQARIKAEDHSSDPPPTTHHSSLPADLSVFHLPLFLQYPLANPSLSAPIQHMSLSADSRCLLVCDGASNIGLFDMEQHRALAVYNLGQTITVRNIISLPLLSVKYRWLVITCQGPYLLSFTFPSAQDSVTIQNVHVSFAIQGLDFLQMSPQVPASDFLQSWHHRTDFHPERGVVVSSKKLLFYDPVNKSFTIVEPASQKETTFAHAGQPLLQLLVLPGKRPDLWAFSSSNLYIYQLSSRKLVQTLSLDEAGDSQRRFRSAVFSPNHESCYVSLGPELLILPTNLHPITLSAAQHHPLPYSCCSILSFATYLILAALDRVEILNPKSLGKIATYLLDPPPSSSSSPSSSTSSISSSPPQICIAQTEDANYLIVGLSTGMVQIFKFDC